MKYAGLRSRRATSNKTRIETADQRSNQARMDGVAEQLPIKQGLKHLSDANITTTKKSRRATSNKTRIETSPFCSIVYNCFSRRATSNKTRIETIQTKWVLQD